MGGSGRMCLVTGYTSGLRGPSPLALTLFGGVRVYRPAPEEPLLWGMPTGSEAFLEMPGACGLWPYPKKGLVPYSFGWWDGGQIPSHLTLVDICLLWKRRKYKVIDKSKELITVFGFENSQKRLFLFTIWLKRKKKRRLELIGWWNDPKMFIVLCCVYLFIHLSIHFKKCLPKYKFFFLSSMVFGLLFSSLLLFPQRFRRYIFRPSSGVCRTRERTQNIELRPLFNPRGSPVLIPLAITGYKC